jgi:hypothetical protein
MAIPPFAWRRGRRVLPLLFLVIPAALSSCGRGERLNSVRGQVFYEGKPADGAVVFFHPQTPRPSKDEAPGDHPSPADLPSGKVGPDGWFELTTYKRGKGASAGRYAVTISWTNSPTGADDDEKELLPPRYLDPATSQLTAEVKQGDNQLSPFLLTR